MKFYDRQDDENPLSGWSYKNPNAVIDLMATLTSRPPFFCEIEAENGFKLLVGVGLNWSCIQYGTNDRSPPYFMAVTKEVQSQAQDMEFLIGNTSTPVSKRYILRSELAWDVIFFFVRTGERSENVGWEEI